MKQIELDGSGWQEPNDFYDALLPQLGAPAWHGRNLDALQDSIFVGDINTVEPPIHISVAAIDTLPQTMREFLERVQAVFSENADKADATISFSPPL
jgi:RNAse (barnase) inhibitor barstar